MNNSDMFKKLTNVQKTKFYNLLSFSIVDNPSLKRVQMCNSGVDDEFISFLMDLMISEGTLKLLLYFSCVLACVHAYTHG